MDTARYMNVLNTVTDHLALREKNLRTVLQFMTDEADGESGEQAVKRRDRYTLFTEDGLGYRYGAGYVYKGKDRLKKRDATNLRRFPTFYTTRMEVFLGEDPNRIVVIGWPTGDQYDDDGNFIRNIPPTEPMLNIFELEDGLIREYGEYNILSEQFPHDLSDIEELRAKGMEDQILD